MNSYRRWSVTMITFAVGLLLCSSKVSAQEQTTSMDAQTETSPGSDSPPSPKTATSASDDNGWHFSLSPYLWFAGVHGTVGALGRNVSMRASPGALLSHFDIGLMGAAEARYHRFLLNGEMMWIRLSDRRALPFPRLSAISADARVGQFVWTSKVGYRVIDHKVKADANLGVRYWHLGQRLNFSPSRLGLNFNGSQNWADILVGGGVQLPLGEKTVVDLRGDVGGWNATAKLDYQFATFLGYRISPKLTLGAGYRYLFIDYRNGPGIFNVVTSGAIVGATFDFK